MVDLFFRVQNLSVGYEGNPVVKSLDFSLGRGECAAIFGHNGSGKSTLLKGLAGLLPQTSGGEILVDNKPLHNLPAWRRVGHLGLLMQNEPVFPRFDVWTNLEMGTRGIKNVSERKQRIEATLSRTNMFKGRWTTPAASLSGGEQQILSLLRISLMRPKVLMLDEPSIGLSPAARQEMLRLLSEMRTERQTMLLVEQDVSFARQLADHFLEIRQGQLKALDHV